MLALARGRAYEMVETSRSWLPFPDGRVRVLAHAGEIDRGDETVRVGEIVHGDNDDHDRSPTQKTQNSKIQTAESPQGICLA